MTEPSLDLTTPEALQAILRSTPFACTTLAPLSGGFANFTFRGHLEKGYVPEGEDAEVHTVIVKHAEAFIAQWRDFKLDVKRSEFEAKLLSQLRPISIAYKTYLVRPPRIYRFLPEASTAIIEDAGSTTTTLKHLLVTNAPLSPSAAHDISIALARFLSELHTWGRAPEQKDLREQIRGFAMPKEATFAATYGRLPDVADQFPDIVGGKRGVFAAVRDYAQKVVFGSNKEDTILHGDYWTGNILVPGHVAKDTDPEASYPMIVVDWEVTKVTSPVYDIGQMAAEMFLPSHFNGNALALDVVRAFIGEYARLQSEMVSVETARQVAMQFGTHLLVYPGSTGWGPEGLDDCIRIGAEYVEKGFNGDEKWLRESLFGALLPGNGS